MKKYSTKYNKAFKTPNFKAPKFNLNKYVKNLPTYDGGGNFNPNIGSALGTIGQLGQQYGQQLSTNADGSVDKTGYGISSAIGMAGTGAALGTMILPGIGTAVGAGLGLIGGFFTGEAKADKMNAQVKQQKLDQQKHDQELANQATQYKAMQQDNYNKSYYSANSAYGNAGASLYGAYGGKFEFGGQVGNSLGRYQTMSNMFNKAKYLGNVGINNYGFGGGLGDPTKADSLALYNNSKMVSDYYKNNPDYIKTGSVESKDYLQGLEKAREKFKLVIPQTATDRKALPMSDYYKTTKNPNQFLQRETNFGVLNMDAPMSLYDKRISPQKFSAFENTSSGRLGADMVNLREYDPLAVKPYSMLTPEEKVQREKLYGKAGFPTNKPIVKNKPIVQTTKDEPVVMNRITTPTSVVPTNSTTTKEKISWDFSNPNYVVDKNTGKMYDHAGDNRKEIQGIVEQYGYGGGMDNPTYNTNADIVNSLNTNYMGRTGSSNNKFYRLNGALATSPISSPTSNPYPMYGMTAPQNQPFSLYRPQVNSQNVNPALQGNAETNPIYQQGRSTNFAYGGQTGGGSAVTYGKYGSGGKIHIKPSHKGRFTAYKERTGKTTEEALHSSDPHVRQMANFARNAAKWHHALGGMLPAYANGGPYDGLYPDGFNNAPSKPSNIDRRAKATYDPSGKLVNGNYIKADGGSLNPLASDMSVANGNTHEQGGIELENKQGQPFAEIEDKEVVKDNRVYSDRIKLPNGKTIAEEAKKLGNKKGKAEERAESIYSRTKNAGKREEAFVDKKLNDLFNLQENLTGRTQNPELGNYSVNAYGGLVKYGFGTNDFDPNNPGIGTNQGAVLTDAQGNQMLANNVYNNNPRGNNPQPVSNINTSGGLYNKGAGTNTTNTSTPYGNRGGWNTALNIGASLIPFVDNAYNANLISKTPDLPTPGVRQGFNAMAMPMKTNYNIDPALNDANSAYRNFNVGADSGQINRANKLGAFSEMLNNKSRLYGTKENMENQMINANQMNIQGVTNQNTANQQNVTNQNLGLKDDYNYRNFMRTNDINQMKSANVSNAVNDANKLVQDRNMKGTQQSQILYNSLAYGDGAGISAQIGTPQFNDMLRSNPEYKASLYNKLKMSGQQDALARFVQMYGQP